jgi:TM2 domain-containing membrane protein YozV
VYKNTISSITLVNWFTPIKSKKLAIVKAVFLFSISCFYSKILQAQNSQLPMAMMASANFNKLANQNYTTFNVAVKKDSISLQKIANHKPKIALLCSAILPGAGQFYNKKYWKIPIVWGAMGAGIYFISTNNVIYRDYRSAILQRVDPNNSVPDKYSGIYSTDQLISLQDQYRQSRDLFIIITSLLYTLNMVDALVDAHLFAFDVSDDLSLKITPSQQNLAGKKYGGISLNLALK